jgi:hypothetical protein
MSSLFHNQINERLSKEPKQNLAELTAGSRPQTELNMYLP